MSTTTKTTGSNTSNLQFNPAAQAMYNQLIGGAGGVLGGYMNQPFQGPAYNLGAGQAQRGAQGAGQNIMQALSGNPGQAGQAGQGFMGAQKAAGGRVTSNTSSQANQSNIMQAFGRQMGAIGTGMSFNPQLTGSTGTFSQTGSTGGFGSWGMPLISAIGASVADYFKGGGGGGGGGGG
jgi:hypothetical protein